MFAKISCAFLGNAVAQIVPIGTQLIACLPHPLQLPRSFAAASQDFQDLIFLESPSFLSLSVSPPPSPLSLSLLPPLLASLQPGAMRRPSVPCSQHGKRVDRQIWGWASRKVINHGRSVLQSCATFEVYFKHPFSGQFCHHLQYCIISMRDETHDYSEGTNYQHDIS